MLLLSSYRFVADEANFRSFQQSPPQVLEKKEALPCAPKDLFLNVENASQVHESQMGRSEKSYLTELYLAEYFVPTHESHCSRLRRVHQRSRVMKYRNVHNSFVQGCHQAISFTLLSATFMQSFTCFHHVQTVSKMKNRSLLNVGLGTFFLRCSDMTNRCHQYLFLFFLVGR